VTQRIEHVVAIAASPGEVWHVLTTPALMAAWMGEPEMQLEIDADWRVGAPVEIRGVHHVAFRNTGTVLRVEPERALAYTHLSSLSRLPDTPENHTEITFALTAAGEGTSLTLTLSEHLCAWDLRLDCLMFHDAPSAASPDSTRRKPASSRTGTPSSCAFVSFEPALSPATR